MLPLISITEQQKQTESTYCQGGNNPLLTAFTKRIIRLQMCCIFLPLSSVGIKTTIKLWLHELICCSCLSAVRMEQLLLLLHLKSFQLWMFLRQLSLADTCWVCHSHTAPPAWTNSSVLMPDSPVFPPQEHDCSPAETRQDASSGPSELQTKTWSDFRDADHQLNTHFGHLWAVHL